MKTVKKALAMMIALIVAFASIPVVSAETSGDFSYSVLSDGTAEISDYSGTASNLIIPDTIDGYSVTSIGDRAFYECSKLSSVTIPNGVTSIGNYAFSYCSGLTSVTIPDGVTNIGEFAFYDCSSLTSVTIPDSVTSIDSCAFYKCSSLTSVTIPDSVTSIGGSAFEYCSSLTAISVSDKNLEYSSLDGVLFNKDKTELIKYPEGKAEFSYDIPNSVTSIWVAAFVECSSLTSVTIPDSVTSIGGWAFSGCSSLTSVTIPDSVTSIGDYAFTCCDSLWHVLYKGTKEQWNAIRIGSENDDLTGARRHYGASGDEIEYIITQEPTCTTDGTAVCHCSVCGKEHSFNYSAALGHDFVNGACIGCGQFIESEHNYANDCDLTWNIYKPYAKQIAVTFSSDTYTESGCDFICIYDRNDNEIGKYSGSELASKVITVQGDTVKIRLMSDNSDTDYGFAVTNIEVTYSDSIFYGDLNGNSSLDIEDSLSLYQYMGGRLLLTDEQKALADVNRDGVLTLADALLLYRVASGRTTL